MEVSHRGYEFVNIGSQLLAKRGIYVEDKTAFICGGSRDAGEH